MFHTHDDGFTGTHTHDGYEHSHVVRVDGMHVVQAGDRCYKTAVPPEAKSITLDVHGVTVTQSARWT